MCLLYNRELCAPGDWQELAKLGPVDCVRCRRTGRGGNPLHCKDFEVMHGYPGSEVKCDTGCKSYCQSDSALAARLLAAPPYGSRTSAQTAGRNVHFDGTASGATAVNQPSDLVPEQTMPGMPTVSYPSPFPPDFSHQQSYTRQRPETPNSPHPTNDFIPSHPEGRDLSRTPSPHPRPRSRSRESNMPSKPDRYDLSRQLYHANKAVEDLSRDKDALKNQNAKLLKENAILSLRNAELMREQARCLERHRGFVAGGRR